MIFRLWIFIILISFKKINEIAYASETEVVNTLLHFFKNKYKKKKNNIEDRASEIVKEARNQNVLIIL